MSKDFIFYRLEIVTRNTDPVFGDSTVTIFHNLESAKKSAYYFRTTCQVLVRIFRIVYNEVIEDDCC